MNDTQIMAEAVNREQEINRLKDERWELIEALKDVYPHIDNGVLRYRIGALIARAQP